MLILPRSHIKDVFHRPDSEVDGDAASSDIVQMRHTVSDPLIYRHKLHVPVVRKQFTRSLADITPLAANEIDRALRDVWGAQPEWHSTELMPGMLRIIARTTSRILYGAELARNVDFVTHVIGYAESILQGGALVSLMPQLLRPAAGWIVRRTGGKHLQAALTCSLPLVQERLDKTRARRDDPPAAPSLPDDGLQWLIDESLKTSDVALCAAPHLAHRLLVLSMLALDSTAFTTAKVLRDVFAHHDAVVPALRAELQRELATAGGRWTKAAIDGCALTDSALRESLRYSCFGLINFPRWVSAEEGVTLSDGTHLPPGVRVAAPMDAIHRDPALYPEPDVYDAFRFAAPSAAGDDGKTTGQAASEEKDEGHEPLTSTTVSDKFLNFGYGRHTCPGRFFATTEIKLIIAHVLLQYDVKPVADGQYNQRFLEFNILKPEAKLEVRRIEHS